jgi:hypothetical protein
MLRQLVFPPANYLAAWAIPHLRPLITQVDDFGAVSAIGVAVDGELTAAVLYNNFLGHDIHMTIASRNPTWCSRAVLRALFHYPFRQLGVARVTACTSVHNRKAVYLLNRLGFVQEGVQRRGVMGQTDLVCFGMLADECRWLEGV